jgi:sugar lactone lactonase YvrE
MPSLKPGKLACAVLLAPAAISWADTVVPGATTPWGHPFGTSESFVRGLAYDGHFYYVADAADHYIDKRPRDNTGRIYIYDRHGTLIKRVPEKPPVRGVFFPHGVATDGVHLWTTDYFGGRIYEYHIATGKLLRTFPSPIVQPIRLDYQASSKTLWLTGYGDPKVYQVNLNGRVRSSFAAGGLPGPNLNPALDGRGDLWVSGIGLDGSNQLKRFSSEGAPLQSYADPGWTSMATNINDRSGGYVQDLPTVFNAAKNRWEARLQHFTVNTVGGRVHHGLTGLDVSCKNLTTAQTATAHFGEPSLWNCDDGGLIVRTGDQVRVEVTGMAR